MNWNLFISTCLTFAAMFVSTGFSQEPGQERNATAQIIILESKDKSKPQKTDEGSSHVEKLRKLAEKVEAYRILPTQNVKDQVIYEIAQMPEKKQSVYLNELTKLSLDVQKIKIHVLIQSALDKINKLPTPDERVAGFKKYREQVSAYVNAGKPSDKKPAPVKAKEKPVAGTRMILQQAPKVAAVPKIIRASYYMDAEQAKELAKFLAVHAPGVAASADGNTLTIHATSDKISAFKPFYTLLRGETKPGPELKGNVKPGQRTFIFGGGAGGVPRKFEAPKKTQKKPVEAKKQPEEIKEKKEKE